MGAGRRLFLALWPTDELRAQIEARTLAIRRATGGRLIPPQNYHVTLLFLGEVPDERVAAVQEASARLASSPAFELRFDCIEAWGRKLLCLTSSTPPPDAAIELVARLRADLSSYMQRPDEREFRPHITLVRDLPHGRRAEKIEPLWQKAADFVLVESVRDAAGSQYSVLARWPLG
jgi:2'-5' RNA ligase